jgi:hypothetical protein
MADTPTPVRVPESLVAFGKALGRDLPASLREVRKLATQAKVSARTNPKRKGG